jgi:hypothetical protein
MGTTAQKLKKLLDNKRAIRDAITEKTGEDAGEVMSTYAEKIMAIEGGGTKYFRTTILLDQTITDPAAMITKVYDDGGISQIRLNSHRYVCKLVDGVMQAKQLQDNNGTLYLDGTTADLTGAEGDVMMKLPEFYYRATEQENDKWLIDFVYGERPSEEYKVWDGKDFIGVYEAYVSSNNVYSRSGVVSTINNSQSAFKTYARNRGEGYTLVKWKHHCIMAFLFYAEYRNTNSQAICGMGIEADEKTCGQTNLLGMEDTSATANGNSQSINFFGLENWWGNKYEWVDNVVGNPTSISSTIMITEDDQTEREVVNTSVGGYSNKMVVGPNLDASIIETKGSENTGYCDYFAYNAVTKTSVLRSGPTRATAGINYYGLYATSTSTTSSRLAYRGEYETFDGVFDAEYEVLEYLRTSGKESIDTNFKPNNNTRLVMDVDNLKAGQFVFGARNGSSSGAFAFYPNIENTIRSDYGASSETATIDSVVGRTTIDKNKNELTAFGVTIINAVSTFACNYNLHLFALKDGSSAILAAEVKFYSCQIYDNGTLIRDYVPVQRRSDYAVGLYDKVNKTFNTPITIA